MKPNNYDKRLMLVVSAFRSLSREKQANLAEVLNVTQGEYCRIERGERALSPGHFHFLCKYLKRPARSLLGFTDLTLEIDFSASLEEVITEALRLMRQGYDLFEVSEEEVRLILTKLHEKISQGAVVEE